MFLLFLFFCFFYCCVFVGVKTSTYKHDAFFFSKLRLAFFRSVTFSTFRFLQQYFLFLFSLLDMGKQTVTLWTAIDFYVYMLFMHVLMFLLSLKKHDLCCFAS